MASKNKPDVVIVESRREDLHASPGQFFLAVPPPYGPFLPRTVFPFRLRGQVVDSFILPPEVEAWTHLGQLSLRGPYGKDFELPAASRRALVLAHDARAAAQLVSLIDALVARECEVTVLCAANDLIERWLPPEVEYRAVEALPSAATELWDWADALYACGTRPMYDQLRAKARQARLKFSAGWAQILLSDLPMPCGLGICYACAFKTTRGVVLNCREGPVIDLADWIGEE